MKNTKDGMEILFLKVKCERMLKNKILFKDLYII